MSRTSAQPAGTRIGVYQILEKIGRGGMGSVYRGQDLHSGKTLAIKLLPGEAATDPVLGLRFAQECQVTRKLDHPHIVRVLDFGVDGSRSYLVMEYVDGESLGQRLEREGRLPEATAVRLIAQVGEALHWAHQRRLIHRDVKPDNILVTGDGQAKLTDLGLAKNLDSDLDLTRTLSGLGTPNFMAPEQFEDARRADALCDLYSLAATLYMTVTGELPFRGRSTRAVATILKKKLANEIAPPRQLVPELSQSLEGAILRGLRADRNERPKSVLEFVGSLTGEPRPVHVHLALPEPASGPNGAAPRPTREKRGRKRYSTRRATACRPLQKAVDDPWVGKVLNISETGLCLELKRRFERGTLLTFVLQGSQTRRRSLVGRVMWVKQLSPESWTMGCQLDRPLSEPEIQEIR
jgi:serine/threonine protein kinase